MEGNNGAEKSYFQNAFDNRVDITNKYLAIGNIPGLLDLSTSDDETIVAAIRTALTEFGGLGKCTELAQDAAETAAELYRRDRIAAIDGTNSISPTRLITETVYAVGVVAVTPQSRNTPRSKATSTNARPRFSTADNKATLDEKLKIWARKLDRAREDEESWTSTFREYEERELATELLEANRVDTVLIDGPILTQNLLSQAEGRKLLKRLTANGSAIGYIKDLSANARLKAIGFALNAGETFTIRNWKTMLTDRFQTGQKSIAEWVQNHGNEMVRVVYKRSRKAYCVECRADKIGLAFSILEHDCVGPTDHDIPLLLHVADSQVRQIFQGDQARDELIARYAANKPNRLIELIPERDLR